MIDLYNRIHRTCAEFAEVADRIVALDPADRGTVMAAFDGHWTRFEMSFGEVESFRQADRSRRTRFLLDLVGAEEVERRAGRVLDASGAVLLTVFLRGVKYATREEVDRMRQRIETLRDPTGRPDLTAAGARPLAASTLH